MTLGPSEWPGHEFSYVYFGFTQPRFGEVDASNPDTPTSSESPNKALLHLAKGQEGGSLTESWQPQPCYKHPRRMPQRKTATWPMYHQPTFRFPHHQPIKSYLNSCQGGPENTLQCTHSVRGDHTGSWDFYSNLAQKLGWHQRRPRVELEPHPTHDVSGGPRANAWGTSTPPSQGGQQRRLGGEPGSTPAPSSQDKLPLRQEATRLWLPSTAGAESEQGS